MQSCENCDKKSRYLSFHRSGTICQTTEYLSFDIIMSFYKFLRPDRVSCARDFVKIAHNFDQHCDLVQHDAFACVTIYFQHSFCKMMDRA